VGVGLDVGGGVLFSGGGRWPAVGGVVVICREGGGGRWGQSLVIDEFLLGLTGGFRSEGESPFFFGRL